MLVALVPILICALIIFGTILNIYDSRFKVNLLEETDLSKLRKLGIQKLELKRYFRSYSLAYGFSPRPSKKQEISLTAPDQSKSTFVNAIEDELWVIGTTPKTTHNIFYCPFSLDNLNILQTKVEDYNQSTPLP